MKEQNQNQVQVEVFNNDEFGQLEVAYINGKVYFPATQCAKVLRYNNPQQAIRLHCKGVLKISTPSNGGSQQANFIPEGDLYRLIVRSKLPAAEKFETWVFDDVLPTLRQTGNYSTSKLKRVDVFREQLAFFTDIFDDKSVKELRMLALIETEKITGEDCSTAKKLLADEIQKQQDATNDITVINLKELLKLYLKEFDQRWTCDILLIDFLYDLFNAWVKRETFVIPPVARNNFKAQIESLIANNPGSQWVVATNPVYTKEKILNPEPLIVEYNLKRWMNPTYNGTDINEICRFQLPDRKRGLVRKSCL